MIQHISKYFLLSVIILLTACQTMKGPSQAVAHQGIRSSVIQYQDAVNKGDLDSLLATYTQNAIQVAPNEPAIVGAQAIRNRAEGNHAIYNYELSSNIEDIQVSGKLATLRASFSETMSLKSDPSDSNTTTGIWVLLFHQQDDSSWKIYTEIWNDEKPIS